MPSLVHLPADGRRRREVRRDREEDGAEGSGRAAAGWRLVKRFKVSRYWLGRIALGVGCMALAVFVGRAIPLLGYVLGAIGLALVLPLKAGDHAG